MTDERYREICAYLKDLLSGTRWEGYVYAVGGCCRDSLLGLPVNDIDLAVALPDGGVELARWLERKRLLTEKPTLFPRFGTSRVRLRAYPDDEIEAVQTRKEKYTSHNSRCPETAFGSVEDDCFRRDFTANSLYMNLSTGKLLDLTGRGVEDVNNRVLRTPLDPDLTFDDDPVRLLRCIRFASKPGWTVDPATYEALGRNVGRLSIVSPMRARSEIEKMLSGPSPCKAMEMMADTGAMVVLLPELKHAISDTSSGSRWLRFLRALRRMDENKAGIELRVAALIWATGNNPAPLMRRLRFDRSVVADTVFLLSMLEAPGRLADKNGRMREHRLRRLQMLCETPERMEQLLYLCLVLADDDSKETILLKDVAGLDRRLREDGTDLYGFVQPLSDVEIRRIKHLRSQSAVSRCRAHLVKMACQNPVRDRRQWVKLLLAYNHGNR